LEFGQRSEFRLTTGSVPKARNLYRARVILYPIKNAIRFENDFANISVILFGNDTAKTRKGCEMPNACDQFCAKLSGCLRIVPGYEANNIFEIIDRWLRKIIL
jgi:hypothetical protein